MSCRVWHKSKATHVAPRRLWAAFAVFLLFMPLCVAAGNDQIRLKDQSDWWSVLNESFHDPQINAKHKKVDDANFRIADITLGQAQFEQASAKLGQATIVERGDASSGRHQVCYVSTGGGQKVYLIFEFGEVESTFYLFADGPDWKGSDRCVSSAKVSASLRTGAGLSLGMPRSQLQAVLGKPDAVVDGRLVYSRELNTRTTQREFEKLRKEYPEELSDKAAHEKFDLQTVEIYIEARFVGSKLAYLAVSTTR